MCGIAGFWGDFSYELLTRMKKSLGHRGPDSSDQWHDSRKGVGLSHNRLSIVDLSPKGSQPMWDVTESVCITYNGELYNYLEIKRELVREGFEFRSDSDTEVLLNLYRRDGDRCLERLNGIFAFAIWDPERNRLLVARDGVGVKPLYFSQTSQGFLFASELKAILQTPHVGRELDLRAVQYHITYLWSPAPSTMLQSVRKLEPGHAMIVADGRIRRRWQYYDLPYTDIGPQADLSVDAAVEGVRERLRDAVARQLVGDVPVGAFLSGGLDSSSVVALYRDVAPSTPIECFTIDFAGRNGRKWSGYSTDLPFAQIAARHLDVNLNVVEVGPDIIERLPEMIFHLDEPQADPAPINALLISELARRTGIKVLLSGAGGDDIFTGYRRHRAVQLEGYWSWLPELARRGLRHVASRVPVSTASARRVAKAFRYADLDDRRRLTSYFYWLPPSQHGSLFSGDVLRELDGKPVDQPMLRALDRLPPDTDRLNAMLYLEGKHFLPDHNLNYTDKMSMASGVEARVPLLDPDLIHFAACVPVRYKQRGRQGKWIFKRAMEPFLPREILERPKTGFGAPLRDWMSSRLVPLRDELLSRDSIDQRGLFEPSAVRALIENDASSRVDATYPIFAMMCIELWCRMFVDQRTPRQIDII